MLRTAVVTYLLPATRYFVYLYVLAIYTPYGLAHRTFEFPLYWCDRGKMEFFYDCAPQLEHDDHTWQADNGSDEKSLLPTLPKFIGLERARAVPPSVANHW